MRNIVIVFSCLSLSSCTETIAPSIESIKPTGYTTVIPSNSPKVGAIYFSGEGQRPKFSTADGTTYNELCYDDYAKTNKLKNISNYIIDEGVRIDSKTVSANLSGNASLGTKPIGSIASVSAGGSASHARTYKVDNVRELSLTDEGKKIITSSLGADCKAAIAKLQEDRNVIFVLSAYRADKVTDTTNINYKGNIGGTLDGTISTADGVSTVKGSGGVIGAERGRADTTTYSLVYLFINPTETGL
jgi:hypothetical protein